MQVANKADKKARKNVNKIGETSTKVPQRANFGVKGNSGLARSTTAGKYGSAQNISIYVPLLKTRASAFTTP